MKFVVDSSAIFSGKGISSSNELFTTPGVISEIRPGGKVRRQFEYLLAAGLSVQSPSSKSIELINQTAERTGDIGRLSSADIEVLALAKDLGAVILTDDYSIQNVAAETGVKYRAVAQEGISQKWTWTYRCTGCGIHFRKAEKECPVCGSPIRTVKAHAEP
jgi:UPF0271 protein